jgi:hypothetical protein
MNTYIKLILLIGITLTLNNTVYSQINVTKLEYVYDGNGNRLTRTMTTTLQINSNPNIENSKSQSIEKKDNQGNFIIGPNPTNSTISIKNVGKTNLECNVRLYSLDGKILINKSFSDFENLDLSQFTIGIYTLILTIGENQFIYKIQKN